MVKTRIRNPVANIVYKVRKAKAQLQSVKTITDIEIPIPDDDGHVVEATGCPTYNNLHSGESYVDVPNCRTLKVVSKKKPIQNSNSCSPCSSEPEKDSNGM